MTGAPPASQCRSQTNRTRASRAHPRPSAFEMAVPSYLLGCGVMRRYGFNSL